MFWGIVSHEEECGSGSSASSDRVVLLASNPAVAVAEEASS